jgi:hypothetical protein
MSSLDVIYIVIGILGVFCVVAGILGLRSHLENSPKLKRVRGIKITEKRNKDVK